MNDYLDEQDKILKKKEDKLFEDMKQLLRGLDGDIVSAIFADTMAKDRIIDAEKVWFRIAQIKADKADSAEASMERMGAKLMGIKAELRKMRGELSPLAEEPKTSEEKKPHYHEGPAGLTERDTYLNPGTVSHWHKTCFGYTSEEKDVEDHRHIVFFPPPGEEEGVFWKAWSGVKVYETKEEKS